jgi:hypothetical protein
MRGQGVALGSTAFVETELKSGRLTRIGRTRVPFGEYLLLEANDRASALLRATFVRWLESEIARAAPG